MSDAPPILRVYKLYETGEIFVSMDSLVKTFEQLEAEVPGMFSHVVQTLELIREKYEKETPLLNRADQIVN